MNARRLTQFLCLLTLLACSLTACASEQTRLIGSYPSQGEPVPLAVLPRSVPQAGIQLVYETRITLEVSRVISAANRAAELVDQQGGYVESANSWVQDGSTAITLVLAVPAPGFEALREDLLDLGSLKGEQITSEWISPTSRSWPAYAHITLTLKPRADFWPDWPLAGWNPGRTLRQAWDVFLTIFGFLVDILIWVVVVLGPFVLIALAVRKLWRKVH